MVAWLLMGVMSGPVGIHASSTPTSCEAHAPPAALFQLPDVSGRVRSLREFRGRLVTLFFYCGCAPCHQCARAWATVQQSGELPLLGKRAPTPPERIATSPAPLTLVVFTGEAEAAQQFAAETGLDAKQTLLLADPEARVGRQYEALLCPRVFVLDAQGRVRYTNPPRRADEESVDAGLSSQILTALRSASTPLGAAKKTPGNRKKHHGK